MNRRRWLAVAAAVAPVVLLLAVAEIALAVFAPFAVTSAGWATSANGLRYGWGFDGGEMVFTRDADDGTVYLDRVNSRGWRDRERRIEKPDGVFRVLVLGDSNVFGYVVAADHTITRKLEDKLASRGVRAEVIAIAQSGWSTDQQLEALRFEGMHYRPDVVVLHFTSNDLLENFMWTFGGKFAERRPFYYTLDDAGALVRHPNPAYRVPFGARVKEYLLRRVELVKRGYTAVQTVRALRKGRWSVAEGHVRLLKLNFGSRATPGFLADMGALVDRPVTEAEIAAVAERHGLADQREFILRVCESANRVEGNLESEFNVPKPTVEDYWRLFFALAKAIRDEAAAGGAPLLLSTDVDEGRWQWERFWGRVSPSPEARARYLHTNQLLRDFAAAASIPFAEPERVIQRARNDAHPNAAGNDAVADNILAALARHGLLPSARPQP